MNAADAYIRHQVNLEQYTKNQLSKMVAALKRTEKEILSKLNARSNTAFSKQRYNTMLLSVRGELASGYKQLGSKMDKSMSMLAKNESKFNKEVLKSISPADTVVAAIDPERLLVATKRTAFQGKTIAHWMRSLEADQAKLITNEIRQGWLMGETNDQIAARLAGNAKTVGVFAKGRNNVHTIVRSGVSQLASQARERTFKKNERLIEYVEWVSTLDGRTTINICAPRDGLPYTVNGDPIDHGEPWDGGPGSIHFNCRSVSVPKIKGQKDIERTGLDYNKETKSRAKSTIRYDKDGRAVVPKGVRAPDAVRKGAGATYAPRTTYSEWFKSQPEWFKKDYLGPLKYEQYKNGVFKISKFNSKDLKPITAKKLKQVSTPRKAVSKKVGRVAPATKYKKTSTDFNGNVITTATLNRYQAIGAKEVEDGLNLPKTLKDAAKKAGDAERKANAAKAAKNAKNPLVADRLMDNLDPKKQSASMTQIERQIYDSKSKTSELQGSIVGRMSEFRQKLLNAGDQVKRNEDFNRWYRNIKIYKMRPGMMNGVRTAFREIHSMSNIRPTTLKYVAQDGRRGYASQSGALSIGAGERRTMFHEYGHHVEFSSKKIEDAATEFLRQRRASTQQTPLVNQLPGHRYSKSEKAYLGDFITPYVGKHYADGATEVISMGLQYFTDAQAMARLYVIDRDYFNFMVGVLKDG